MVSATNCDQFSFPNDHILHSVTAALQTIDIASATELSTADPRTELDSHANMIVLGKHAFVFEHTGRTCNVRPFTSELGVAPNVPIADVNRICIS